MPEGEGYQGETELHPRSARPDSYTAATQLRARMPPAARGAAYIYAPRAWGGAGHLNKRPIEGRRRAQVARPTCAVGDAGIPVPLVHTAAGVRCGKERGGFFGKLGRGALQEERGESNHFLLSRTTSQRDSPAPAVAPIALVLHWQSLAVSPRTLEGLTCPDASQGWS